MEVYVAGYKGRGKVSRLIKWFSFGKYSHVSLVFDMPNSKPIEIDARIKVGVTRHHLKLEGSFDLFHIPCTPEQAWEIYAHARDLIGSEYDKAGIWGFLRRSNAQNPLKWFCSELVSYCLYKAGIVLYRMPCWKQSPFLVCVCTLITPVDMPEQWRK
jgi:hypothetical protein